MIRSHRVHFFQCCAVLRGKTFPVCHSEHRERLRLVSGPSHQCFGHRGGQPAEMLRQVAQRLAGTARRGISTSALCREGEDKGPKGVQRLARAETCWHISKCLMNLHECLSAALSSKIEDSVNRKYQFCMLAASRHAVQISERAAICLCRVRQEVQAPRFVHFERPQLPFRLPSKKRKGRGRGPNCSTGKAHPKLLPAS